MEIDKTKEEEIREMYKNGCGEIRKVLERLFPNLSKTYPYYGKNNATPVLFIKNDGESEFKSFLNHFERSLKGHGKVFGSCSIATSIVTGKH